MLIDILDLIEKLFIQTDVIGMLGEDRTHLLCQGIEVVVRLSTQQIEKDI